jgi:hypothetical protein
VTSDREAPAIHCWKWPGVSQRTAGYYGSSALLVRRLTSLYPGRVGGSMGWFVPTPYPKEAVPWA